MVIAGIAFGQLQPRVIRGAATGEITGTVLDSTTHTPMQYANLVAYQQRDSTQISGAVSDKNGRFRVTGLPAGIYFLEVGFVGYKKKQVDNIRIAPPKISVDVDTILLAVTPLNSSQVVVEGQRSQMELSFEKRVFQVGTDITSMGGSVLDLLNNVPALQADFKGNISLRGSQAVRILINGKPSRIYQNGSLALQNLPADMIKEIQVITNPSAKYGAEGSAGIINIILKKKQEHGFHGNIGVMQRRPEASQISTNLNYRSGKINWFFNGGVAYATDPAYHRTYQRFHSVDTSYIYHAYNNGNETDYHGDFQLGADLHFTPQQTLTASALWHFENKKDLWDGAYIDSTITGEFLDRINRHNTIGGGEGANELTLDYENKLGGERHTLTANIDYEFGKDKELPNIWETNPSTPADTLFHKISDIRNNRDLRLRADYVHPFADSGKVEAGIRSTYHWGDHTYTTRERRNRQWTSLPAFYDNFTSREALNAAYATLSSHTGSYSYQLGIRGEQYNIRTLLKDIRQRTHQSYLDVFPSIFLTYKLNEQQSIQVSYSRRISRPSARSLLPTTNYSSSRSRFTGNPDLQPEYGNSYEADFLQYWDTGSLLAGLYYRHRTGVIEEISRLDTDGVMRTIPFNLAIADAWGLELTGDKEFTDSFQLTGSLNLFRSKSEGVYHGTIYRSATTRLTSRLGVQWTIPSGLKLQSFIRYYGPATTIQGHRSSTAFMNIALAKDLFNDHATISLSSEDLFNTRREKYTITDPTYFSRQQSWEPNGIRLNFTYRINEKKGNEE